VALFAFRRAFDLSEYTGCSNQSAEAAIATLRELGEHLAVIEDGQLLPGRGLREEKRSLEHEGIKAALEQANGSVTQAARSLGISFQALTYMLNTRHKDLLKKRTPVAAASFTEANVIDCLAMKTVKSKEPATSGEYQRFEKFAKALMAVSKKELDRELAKDERKKKTGRTKQ
jgi:hypothetical protein